MKHYFETVDRDGSAYPLTMAHETIEEAIDYADAHGITFICEIGSAWEEFEKCAFCGDWVTSYEVDKDGFCERCMMALKSHGDI